MAGFAKQNLVLSWDVWDLMVLGTYGNYIPTSQLKPAALMHNETFFRYVAKQGLKKFRSGTDTGYLPKQMDDLAVKKNY